MYKLQMKFQRIVSYLCFASAALAFFYSLGCMTDVYFLYKIEAINYVVPGADMFYEMQPFNKTLTDLCVAFILVCVACFVFNNHSRRKYYFVNYLTSTICSASGLCLAVWSLVNVFKYKAMFLNVEFDVLAEIVDTVPEFVLKSNGIDPSNLSGPYSTFWFDISAVVFGIMIITSLLCIFNMFLKSAVMASERRALEKGDE